MKNLSHILILSILLFLSQIGIAQSANKGYRIKANIGLGLNLHPDHMVIFPTISSIESYRITNQQAILGYNISVKGLKEINEWFSFGISVNFSSFGFNEKGKIYILGRPTSSDYSINREFETLGSGIVLGIDLFENEKNKLSFYSGVHYETIILTRNVNWGKDRYANFSLNSENTLEFSHYIGEKLSITSGFQAVLRQKNFFERIDYRPLRYGIFLGLEYRFH